MNYYRVQKAAIGIREYLTGAMSLEAAKAHLNSIVRNLVANGYIAADQDTIRKLPVVILGKNGNTVALSVVECSADDVIETKRELAELTWLTRVPQAANSEAVSDYTVDVDRTPTEGLFVDELADTIEIEVAQNA